MKKKNELKLKPRTSSSPLRYSKWLCVAFDFFTRCEAIQNNVIFPLQLLCIQIAIVHTSCLHKHMFIGCRIRFGTFHVPMFHAAIVCRNFLWKIFHRLTWIGKVCVVHTTIKQKQKWNWIHWIAQTAMIWLIRRSIVFLVLHCYQHFVQMKAKTLLITLHKGAKRMTKKFKQKVVFTIMLVNGLLSPMQFDPVVWLLNVNAREAKQKTKTIAESYAIKSSSPKIVRTLRVDWSSPPPPLHTFVGSTIVGVNTNFW